MLMEREALGRFRKFLLWKFAGMAMQLTVVGHMGGEGDVVLSSA